MTHLPAPHRPNTTAFPGFEPLSSNYVYCPNQFLDLCLAHGSRGTVRIVAYILRQTLGWLDHNGNPLRQEIVVSYQDLIDKAGVSRGAIKPALKEAVSSGFLTCQQTAASYSAGQTAQSAAYALRWDRQGEYQKEPQQFAGFFAGEGYRTPVPNRFFDEIVPHESLSVVKVVGAVIRHTIGYQNQFGGRRSSSPLSYSHIQNYTQIRDRSTVAQSIRHAQEVGYIQCVEAGEFGADKRVQRAASYAIRWLAEAKTPNNSSKNRPEQDQSKNPTRNGSESRPEERFKNPTSIRKTKPKDISKQQLAAADGEEGIQLLLDQGLDRRTAAMLIKEHGLPLVQQQVQWLEARKPTENRAGLLRKAIVENWAMPSAFQRRQQITKLREKQHRTDDRQRQLDHEVAARRKARQQRRERLLAEWANASIEERQHWIEAAVARETSAVLAEMIRRDSAELSNPRLQILDAIASDRNLPGVMVIEQP